MAPEQTTSRSFARALGRALHRPAILPLPACALKMIFGEAATVLLASQRVDLACSGSTSSRSTFRRWTRRSRTLSGAPPSRSRPRSRDPEGAGEARHELRARTVIDALLDQTFAFFSKAANLGVITPAAMRFSIQGQAAADGGGAVIDHRVRVGPLPVRWRTASPRGSRAEALPIFKRRPYRFWWHNHTFQADGPRTVMEDRVYYTPPLGLFGRLANRVFIRSTLRKIFSIEAMIRLIRSVVA